MFTAGGSTNEEVFSGDFKTKNFPKLPTNILAPSMIMHNETILLCGGADNEQKCLQLSRGNWKVHSTLNDQRMRHSAVSTKTATFIFGGNLSRSRLTYEYLPKDSTRWLKGKKEIPGGFDSGCALAVKSEQEIWLIGGYQTGKRILSFNVINHNFKELPFQLNVERSGHRIAYIPKTKKVMITGGFKNENDFLYSTEILDTESGSVSMASPMNSRRLYHGIGAIKINGEDKLAVFGNVDTPRTMLESVELYNNQRDKWETSTIKLSIEELCFGFLSIRLADIIKINSYHI